MAEQALADIKAVDVAYDIAGPYCTRLPSDLGGAVTKNEKPGEGDPARGKDLFFKNLPHPEKKRALPDS